VGIFENQVSKKEKNMKKPFPAVPGLGGWTITPAKVREDVFVMLQRLNAPVTVRELMEVNLYLRRAGSVKVYEALHVLYGSGTVDFKYENEGKRGRPRYVFWLV